MPRSKRPNFSHNVALCACSHCSSDWDAAKRMADTINIVIDANRADVFSIKDKWLAFRLSDGQGDGNLYDSKRDAVRHQHNEFTAVYICMRNCLGGAHPAETVRFLNFTRDAYDAGMRLPDPDDVNGGRDVAPTSARMDDARGLVVAVLKPELARIGALMLGVN